jgi:hypothetical protein
MDELAELLSAPAGDGEQITDDEALLTAIQEHQADVALKPAINEASAALPLANLSGTKRTSTAMQGAHHQVNILTVIHL